MSKNSAQYCYTYFLATPYCPGLSWGTVRFSLRHGALIKASECLSIFLLNLGVILKNNARNITCMYLKGTYFAAPGLIFFVCLDLEQKYSFMDRHELWR